MTHKHWDQMDAKEQVATLTDLRHVVKTIPVEKLRMQQYITSAVQMFNGTVDDIDINAYHNCGTAFCVLGWVAPIERFAKAFNIEHNVERITDVGESGVQVRLRVEDWAGPARPWQHIPELHDIFNGDMQSKGQTYRHKQEVLGRIDRAIAKL